MLEDATASTTAALVTRLLGLDEFSVLAAEIDGELELLVQTSADLVGCPGSGAVKRAKDRRPVVLCWWKRIWCCPHEVCATKTWTESHEAIAARAHAEGGVHTRSVDGIC